MLLALIPLVNAQVDVHGLLPAGLDADVRDPVHLRRPGHLSRGDAFVGGLLGYASRPLVVENLELGESRALVEDVFALDLSAGWAPAQRVRLDVEVPLYGFSGVSIDQGYDQPADAGGVGVADARVSALLLVVDPGEDDTGFGLGLVPSVLLPTGQIHDYFGRKALGVGAAVSASVALSDVQLVGQAGLQVSPGDDTTVPRGSSVEAGLAGTWLLGDTLGVGADLVASLPLYGAPGTTALPVQGVVRARYAGDNGAHFLGGLGFGLSDGVGVPSFRVFVGGGFGIRGALGDRDADGIVDSLDVCPDEPETPNGLEDTDGCPDRRPRLSIAPSLDGRTVPGVSMALAGPVERSWTSTPQPQVIEVDPASVWKATAILEPCLVGEGIATVGEADHDLVVELARKEIAEVEFFVVDDAGEPASGVEVAIHSALAHCAPESFTLDASGSGTLRLGPGLHEFVIHTDEGLHGTASWTAVEGERHTALIVLSRRR